MLTKERKLTLLKEALGRPAFEKPAKSEVVFYCPICRHQKPKLSVNLDTDWYNCWTCEEGKTKGRTLLGILRGRVRSESISEYLDSLSARPSRRIEPVKVQNEPPKLPDEFLSLSSARRDSFDLIPYYSYLRNRGVSEEDLVFYRLGACQRGDFGGRIVIPSFDSEGYLNFFTARKVFSDSFGQSYMTCDASKDIIFNDCLVDWKLPVIIVEGPFDMMTAGRNAIPLQGKLLRSDSQLFSKIVLSGVRVYLAMDSDARYDQIATAHTLFRYGVDVRTVDLGGWKDVSEMGRERFFDRLKLAEAYEWNSKVKMLCA